MGAMFAHHQRRGCGQIEDLSDNMTGAVSAAQLVAAGVAAGRKMIDDQIRRGGLAQGFAGLPGLPDLPAGRLARCAAQAAGPRRLLQPVARRRLAAIAAVQAKAALQLRHAGQKLRVLRNKCGVLCNKHRVLRLQCGNQRQRSPSRGRKLVTKIEILGRCHQHLDSRKPVFRQSPRNRASLGSYLF